MDKNALLPERILKAVCDAIVEICSPEKIILYSEKHTPAGVVSGAKFCVIISGGNSDEVEERLYIEFDFSFPCDFLVYTKEEFTRLLGEEFSFANKIVECGRVIYEAH